eukprot:15442175-Alexandrium_andersonii.AAC.1
MPPWIPLHQNTHTHTTTREELNMTDPMRGTFWTAHREASSLGDFLLRWPARGPDQDLRVRIL